MRTYKVTGMTCGGCEKSVTQAIKKQLGEDTAVEANAKTGEVRVDASADSQMVIFAIDGAGYGVEEVRD
ncbi:heavy-metal-associated domain-containing protein [Microvirga sp. GCM10011540]|uniref:heavy-metal-associated domain-containing protein n=1 Tax=Microvirga sp. GCM10011540 TaxID=3317338 RepID=UPI0036164C5D